MALTFQEATTPDFKLYFVYTKTEPQKKFTERTRQEARKTKHDLRKQGVNSQIIERSYYGQFEFERIIS